MQLPLDELQELDSERAATHEKLKDREAKAQALLAAVRAATGDRSSPFASASGDTFESRNVLLYLTSDWSMIVRRAFRQLCTDDREFLSRLTWYRMEPSGGCGVSEGGR